MLQTTTLMFSTSPGDNSFADSNKLSCTKRV
jgi:hypothetical protein